MNILSRTLLSFLAAGLLPLAAAHADDLAQIKSAGVIKIGTEAHMLRFPSTTPRTN